MVSGEIDQEVDLFHRSRVFEFLAGGGARLRQSKNGRLDAHQQAEFGQRRLRVGADKDDGVALAPQSPRQRLVPAPPFSRPNRHPDTQSSGRVHAAAGSGSAMRARARRRTSGNNRSDSGAELKSSGGEGRGKPQALLSTAMF